MAPTLAINDVILVETNAEIRNGDIVVFKPPPQLGTTNFTKRIVASGGDSLSLRDGVLKRNGVTVAEPFVAEPTNYELEIRSYHIYVDGISLDPARAVIPPRSEWQAQDRVPNGYLVVLGDNRNDSDDSHLWGFLKRDQVVGRLYQIIWPMNRVKRF